ncbi:uncharacterized protein LOC135480685 [Liolophura sinensis]|uniref:uncharacterized protein LOC135480685 n=1 Tax=Liolophura sinensis TaxID=3198878 RepID=UPI003158BDF9
MGCATSQRKIKPDTNANDICEGDKGMTKVTLRGDVTQCLAAREERLRRVREKQGRMLGAAEAMSARVMDDHERLSLSTRATSRATSRNTSGTTSPTNQPAIKHVKFADKGAMLSRGDSFSKQWFSGGRDGFKEIKDYHYFGSRKRMASPEDPSTQNIACKSVLKTPTIVFPTWSPRDGTEMDKLSRAVAVI